MASIQEESKLTIEEEGNVVVDGVRRHAATGIKAIVVGCGPGGLLAALELWRKGNDVVVLEQSPQFSPAGDFFTITPSGLSTIKYYPTMRVEYEANANDAAIRFSTSDCRLIFEHEPEWKLCKDGHAAEDVKTSMLNRRAQFQAMIKNQCTRVGIPFHFNMKVVDYQETNEEASVLLADGQRVTADFVVAADGIATASNQLIRGGEINYKSTGYVSARGGFPKAAIDPKSKAGHLLPLHGERPQFNVYVSSTGDLILFFISDYVGFAFTHKDLNGDARESWSPKVDPEEIIRMHFKTGEWDERILDFARQIPIQLVDWCLTWRDPHPRWVSPGGRVVQVGDAAHPFLPTSGNGATQAFEDGISLAECISLGGKSCVQTSTKVHNLLRYQRVSIIQRTGFVNRNSVTNYDPTDLAAFKNPMIWGKWNWGCKPEDYVRERFEEALAHVNDGNESQFQNTNLPPGHVWEAWTMEEELQRIRENQSTDIKQNGYWGYQ